MSLVEVTAVVKSCVLSRKEDTTIDALEDDYFELIGERMPFKKLGFYSVKHLLEALPDIQVVTNMHGKSVVRAGSEKAAHITKLVSKQKVAPKKKKKQKWNGPTNYGKYSNNWGFTAGPAKTTSFTIHRKYSPRKSLSSPRTYLQTSSQTSQRPAILPPRSNLPYRQRSSFIAETPVTSYPPASAYFDSSQRASDRVVCAVNAVPAGEEEDVAQSSDDWQSDDGFAPPPPVIAYRVKRPLVSEARVKLEDAIAKELESPPRARLCPPASVFQPSREVIHRGLLPHEVVQRGLISREMIHRGLLSSPSKFTGIDAVENKPSCIFDTLALQEELRRDRAVTGSGENLRVAVKNDYKACSEVSSEDDSRPWVEKVLKSLPDGWRPPPCVWDTYFLGDDFSIQFMAEDMKCGYNKAEVPSSCLCFPGFTINDGYEFIKSLNWVPERIFVMLGYIDILNGHRLEYIKKDMLSLVNFLAERAKHVGLCTLPFIGSSFGYNSQVVTLNNFLNSLECDRVSVIDCCSIFKDNYGCLDELCYETKPTPLSKLQEPVKLWNDVGRRSLYVFMFKKMREFYVKSFGYSRCF